MVSMVAPSRMKREKSSSEEAVEYEAALRRTINDLPVTPVEQDEILMILSRIVNQLITADIALKRPILRAMRDHFLMTISNSISLTSNYQDDEQEPDDEHDDINEHDNNDNEKNDENADHGNSNINDKNIIDEKAWLDIRKIVLQSVDTFLSVHVIGARAKVSAFFDKLIRDTRWFRIAIVAGSTVAEDAFLAVNSWGGSKKSLTVIDVGECCPGQDTVKRLGWQTQVNVRYAPLSSTYKALENVDVVVMGAREIMMNGHVIVDSGGAFITQAAQEIGVPVVITTQSIKYTDRILVDWFVDGGDVLKPREIQSIVTELDTNTWRPTFVPDVLKKMSGA